MPSPEPAREQDPEPSPGNQEPSPENSSPGIAAPVQVIQGGGGNGWNISKIQAVVSLVVTLGLLFAGAVTVYNQTLTNAKDIEEIQSDIKGVQAAVGFVQMDVNAICIKLHDGDLGKCNTSGLHP